MSIPPYKKLHSGCTASGISNTSQGIISQIGNRKPKKGNAEEGKQEKSHTSPLLVHQMIYNLVKSKGGKYLSYTAHFVTYFVSRVELFINE